MMSSKRFILLLTIIAALTFVFAGYSKNPEIIASITLDKVTQEEYDQIGESSKSEDVTIDDLRKLLVEVKLINSKNLEERKITIPDLLIIDRIDGFRSVSAGSYDRNNIGKEDTAEKTAYIIFNIRGLSEQDLRNIYKDSEIYIAYKYKNGDLVEKSISVGDNLTIKY